MIKINLALRKQSTTAVSDPKTGATARPKATDQLEALKSLPIAKILALVAVYYGASWFVDSTKEDEISKIEGTIGALTAQQNSLKADLQKTKGYEEVKKALEADELMIRTKLDTVQKLISDRQNTPKILFSLTNDIPKDVWLTEFTVSGEEFKLQGYSLGYNPVSDFMKTLTEGTYVTDVRLVSSEQSKDDTGQELARFEVGAKKK